MGLNCTNGKVYAIDEVGETHDEWVNVTTNTHSTYEPKVLDLPELPENLGVSKD